jgi:hypothetical protein
VRSDLIEGFYRLVELLQLLHPQPLALAYELPERTCYYFIVLDDQPLSEHMCQQTRSYQGKNRGPGQLGLVVQ